MIRDQCGKSREFWKTIIWNFVCHANTPGKVLSLVGYILGAMLTSYHGPYCLKKIIYKNHNNLWDKKTYSLITKTRLINALFLRRIIYYSVADLGFPRGMGADSPGGTNIRFCQNFPKTSWNWKNLDPRGDARPKFYYVDPPLLFNKII